MRVSTGDMVAYRGGQTKYEAIRTGVGWDNRKYTLVSQKTGRKRYNVSEKDLTRWEERVPVKPVKTSLGRVRRPKNWKTLESFAGGARRTFIDKDWVYKIGHSDWGQERCAVEAARYAMMAGATLEDIETRYGYSVAQDVKYYSDVPVAECYLLEDGTLLMERVTPVRSLQARDGAPTMDAEERERRGFGYRGSGYPRWSNKVDSSQIGLTRKGELVAYDL